ncbi:probable cytochrome P450 4ac1 [Sitodiplosis mosellana]|uniref:probable cytochrome P450 4ac1 n=1 Tax=Sitodiplosis mosellana TaxID=263140 RepID=UPI00244451E6|nr:probable cytochrome P450 4ac1 [Sitodiplosis mosellana]
MIWDIMILIIIDLLREKVPYLRTVYVYFTLFNFMVRQFTSYGVASSIPGPRMFPIIGSISLLLTPQRKMFKKLMNYCKLYPNGFRYWCFGSFTYNTYSAESIEKILTNSKHGQRNASSGLLRTYLNGSSITSSANKWVMQHEKTSDSIKSSDFRSKFLDQTKWLKEEIQRNELKKPDGSNLQKLISRYLLGVDGIQEIDQIGYDKALNAIIFTLSMLANYHDVQQRLYEEITLKLDEDNDENYLNAVVKEVLRLYPPVTVVERILGEETIIDGENAVKLPAKTCVQIQIYALHRDAKYFENPEQFDPNRFLNDSLAKYTSGSPTCVYNGDHHPFAYIPFGTSDLNCIDQKFAEMAIGAVATEIVKHFELKPITKVEDFDLMHDSVLKTQEPIRVEFVSRAA